VHVFTGIGDTSAPRRAACSAWVGAMTYPQPGLPLITFAGVNVTQPRAVGEKADQR
jgi:hypothetical protein